MCYFRLFFFPFISKNDKKIGIVQKYIGVVEEKHDKKWYNPHNNQKIFEIFLAEMTKSHEFLYKKGGQRK